MAEGGLNQLAPEAIMDDLEVDLEDEEDEDLEDIRFLDVCIDGDVDDLVQLLEEMAKDGEMLTPEMLNCPDQSGRVRK